MTCIQRICQSISVDFFAIFTCTRRILGRADRIRKKPTSYVIYSVKDSLGSFSVFQINKKRGDIGGAVTDGACC